MCRTADLTFMAHPEGKGMAAKGAVALDSFSFADRARGWQPNPATTVALETDAVVNIGAKKYSILTGRLFIGSSRLDLSGEMDGEKYDFKFKSDNLDVSEVADLVYPLKKMMTDRGLVLNGPMALDGTVHAASPAVLEVNLDLQQTEIKYPGALNKAAGEKLLVKIASKRQSADSMLEDLLLSFGGGDLVGKGTLSKDYDLNLGLSGKDISMEELAKLVEPLSSYNLRGRMNLNGTLYGKLTDAALLNFTIRELTMVGQDMDLALNGEVKNLSEPNINFNLEGQKLDVGGLMKPGPGAKVKKKMADPTDRSDPTAGHKSTLERIRLEGRIKLAQISYAPYQLSNFNSGFNMQDGVASLPDSSFGIFNGSARGPVSVDLKGKKPKYQGNLALAGVDVPSLLKNFTTMADKLEGKLDGNLAFAGKGSSWEEINPNLLGNGKFTVKQGSIKGFNLVGSLLGDWAKSSQFQSLVQTSMTPSQWESLKQTDFNSILAVFDLKDGGMNISDLSMLIPDGKVSGKGRVGFDAKTKMAGLLLLDEIPSKQIAKQIGLSPQVVNVLFQDGKNLLLPFLMTGSFPTLAVLLDPTQYGSIMGNNMKGSLTNLNNLDLNSLFNPKSGASQGSTAKSGASQGSTVKSGGKSKNKSKSGKNSGSSDLQKDVEKGVGDLLQGLNPKP